MSIWFEGSSEIECTLQRVQESFEDLGAHWVGVVGHMPGMTEVELLEQGSDFVTIRTNEGVMKRTAVTMRTEGEAMVVEFDEEYQAGTRVTANSRFREEFTATETGVRYNVVISDVEFPGLLGFFYRKFGSNNIGKAFLRAHQEHFG